MTTADRIHEARRRAGYKTAKEFAAALGERVGTVYSWESASKRKIPRPRTLCRIADLCGVTVAYLLGEEETTMPHTDDRAGWVIHHPGVEALAADAPRRAQYHVTESELSLLRRLRPPDDKPLDTVEAALAGLGVIRAVGYPQPPPRGR